MKIIIDTNIWISFFISKSFNKLREILLNNSIEIIFSVELSEEIKSVINREKFKKVINKEIVDEILNLIILRCRFYNIQQSVDLCRDKNDNFLLELANISKADYLITGDYDLLDMCRYRGTEIIKWKNFIEKLFL